jgi:hypothetical protein
MLEGIAAKHLALSRECRIGVEDAQTAADHDDDGDEVDPVGHAHDPVVALSTHVYDPGDAGFLILSL